MSKNWCCATNRPCALCPNPSSPAANLAEEFREAAKALTDGRFWEIDTGHDLMITEPEFVADVLAQIAARAAGSFSQ